MNKRLRILLFTFFVVGLLTVLTIPLHEGLHWVMCGIDPNIMPVKPHFFDNYAYKWGTIACVEVKYFGRPVFFNHFVQEVICFSIQFLVMFLVGCYLMVKHAKRVKNVQQKF